MLSVVMRNFSTRPVVRYLATKNNLSNFNHTHFIAQESSAAVRRKGIGRWEPDELERLKQAITSVGSHDWVLISLHVKTRDNIQCRQKYYRDINPEINRGDWTLEEDAELLAAIKRYGRGKWSRIREVLSTNRTDIQCMQRFDALSTVRKRMPWTEEEKATLLQAAAKYASSNDKQQSTKIDWIAVCDAVGTRTNAQCREKYKLLQKIPQLTLGNWTPAEDLMLVRLIKRFGEHRWAQIHAHFPSRSSSQCRQRWMLLQRRFYFRDPSHPPPRVVWTKEADERLLELVKIHGRRWVKIFNKMSTEGKYFTSIHELDPLICEWRYERLKTENQIQTTNRGIWSEAETVQLRELVDEYGKQWRLIAEKMGTRTNLQCRAKYFAINPAEQNVIKGKWSKEECDELLSLVLTEGRRWESISKKLNRTPRCCLKKYSQMMR